MRPDDDETVTPEEVADSIATTRMDRRALRDLVDDGDTQSSVDELDGGRAPSGPIDVRELEGSLDPPDLPTEQDTPRVAVIRSGPDPAGPRSDGTGLPGPAALAILAAAAFLGFALVVLAGAVLAAIGLLLL